MTNQLYFRYQSLAEFGRNKNESENSRMAEPDWTYNLGEAILALDSVALSTMETGIIVISEKNLYYFNDTLLSVEFTIRYAYNVLCIQSYIMGKFLYSILTCIVFSFFFGNIEY